MMNAAAGRKERHAVDVSTIHNAKILIVDDEQAHVDLLGRMLKHEGYTNVVSTTNPLHVLSLFGAHQPALIMLDLVMPHLDGCALLEQLARRTGASTFVPIIVLTDNAMPQAKHRALALGAKDVLSKPFDAAEVLLRVWNVLETRLLQLQVQQHAGAPPATTHTQELETALGRVAQAVEGNHTDNPHPQRVGRWAAQVALQLGWTDDQAARLRYAALLHDIGMLRVPNQMWNKPERLSPADATLVQRHATLGSALLAGSSSPLLVLAEEIARTHHERWDGTGYPSRLRGAAIPLSGRIVAVVDAFDAMTHARPFQPSRSIPDAVAELQRERSRQFDPAVVDAFVAVLRREGLLAGLRLGA